MFFSILLIGTVYAEDIDDNMTATDDSFESIQNAIDDSDPGDSIYLENKTYFGNGTNIKINKDISIYGSNVSDTVLDANGKSNVFTISSNVKVTLYDLTFINGKTTSNGGAINNNGNLIVYNSKFSDNTAYHTASGRVNGDGGAINNNGILTIYNSNFTDNYAYNGGAVRGSQNSKITAYDCTFDNNRATFGVALDTYFSDSVIVNCIFTNNAGHEGGAIYNRFSDFRLINSTFVNNSATRGGGIYNNRGYLVINSSRFISNSATHLGGGVKSWGVCEIYDSVLKNNEGETGGGAYISEYLMTVRNCTFENNVAVEGGGVAADSDGHLDIRNCTLNNNSAENGGGVDCTWGYLNLDNCILNNNFATDKGGGIACILFESNVTNAILNNNNAPYGGGLYIGKITVNFSNLTLNNNSSSYGGGVYNEGNSILNNFKIMNNYAPNGGGIYNAKGDLTFINSEVISNKAVNGAGIYNNAKVKFYNLNANSNAASSYGGFAYNSGIIVLNSSELTSNAANFAGVVYNKMSISIVDSSFSHNKANRGAVIVNYADLIMDNSNVSNNEVLHTEGVINIIAGNVNITDCIFKSNKGSDEGGVIFNSNATVFIKGSQFISNSAISYGGAIDNAGEITIADSLFDKNKAYGAGAIDNGGNLELINCKFTNNMATKNGGAIDNNNVLNVVGSVFENNVAGAQGGAIIARKDINLTHCSLSNNQASQGGTIYANNRYSNLSKNWWGSNKPDFSKLFNFNISNAFNWIVISLKSSPDFIQYESVNVIININEVMDGNGSVSKLESLDLLPTFEVASSLGKILNVYNGYLSIKMSVPKVSSIKFSLDNQVNTFKTLKNPSKISSKSVVVDYSGKVTFKVRVYGVDGKAVSKNQVVVMKLSGKSYNVKTDSKGYASKTFTLTPGIYAITSTYKGSTFKNTINVKKVLWASSKVVKKANKIKYSARLKTSNGKAISGKIITFKIKGKTYSAKTDKKGIGTVAFKNLKAGKYTVIVKYLKSQVKIILNVKK